MFHRPQANLRNRAPQQIRARVLSRRSRVRHEAAAGKRSRSGEAKRQGPFVPPEDWYEPEDQRQPGYRIVVQPPGDGYRHVVTPQQIRQRLAQLPICMLEALEVIQLSRMTRKKRTFPCYGMQWGNTLYLYPIETELVEYFHRPPRPAERNEALMYGGQWVEQDDTWKLIWSEEAIQDFYLNNILIHELGHLLDNRNRSCTDRERYAEWFAIQHGYKASRRQTLAASAAKKMVRRRHHSGR